MGTECWAPCVWCWRGWSAFIKLIKQNRTKEKTGTGVRGGTGRGSKRKGRRGLKN